MAFLKVKNRAISSLVSSVTSTATTWTVAAGEGSKFPGSGDFHITCEDEIVKCTSRSGDVLTVVRAQEGTSAASHDAGQAVELRVTAGIIENLQSEIYSHTQDVNYNKYKAIALVCDNGSTVPSNPAAGQWFLHTPTGRKVLMKYDGSSWINIISIGSMTMYVDKTDGSDTMDKGGAPDSGAFASVQYAIDRIPGLVGGDVTIYINAEDYSESVTIQGKNFTANYSINIYGTQSQLATGTIESAVQGSGATQGSITDTGQFGSYDNKLIYANSEYRIIDSDTVNVSTIVGCWSATPSGIWVVYDWGTTINNITIAAGQLNVYVYDIKFDTVTGISLGANSNASFIRCYSLEANNNGGNLTVDTCFVTATNQAINTLRQGISILQKSKIEVTASNKKCLRVYDLSYLALYQGSILEGNSQSGSVGAQVWGNSSLSCYQTAANGYARIRNLGTGIQAYEGGQVSFTSNNQYSGNTTNEDAISASYGYID